MGPNRHGWGAFLIGIMFGCALGSLTVMGPQTLINELPAAKTIPYTINNFGTIPYGRSVSGYLSLSYPIDGCSLLKTPAPDASPVFLLSMRGKCTYVTKAKYAQLSGAKVLIIISEQRDIKSEDLNDDGFGSSIHIPSVVINERYGTMLINYLESKKDMNNRILLTLEFDVERVDNQLLSYTFWLSSANRNSYKLVRDFKPYYEKLKDYAKFHVHYLFWSCETCAVNNYQLIDIPENCVSGGRYCCADPDGEGMANGRDIILEDLRQICLFQKDEEKYFDYIDIFDLKCVEFQVLEECSKDILKELGLDFLEIQSCFDSSFIRKNDLNEVNPIFDDNVLLKGEKRASNYHNVQFWPSVTINNMTFQGNLESPAIFEAICSVFTHPPDFCIKFSDLNQNNSQDQENSNFKVFFLIFLLFFCVFIVMVRIYKKIVKSELEREMNTSIQNMMNQYINIIDKK